LNEAGEVPRRGIRGDRRCGFTLFEILIAIAILAIVLTIAYSSFSALSGRIASAETTSRVYHIARITMDRMSMDLSNAYLKKNETETEQLFSFEYVPSSDGLTWNRFSFTSTAHMALRSDEQGLDLCRISYELRPEDENSDNKRYSLYRSDTALFLNGVAAPAIQIGSRFSRFEVLFFDTGDEPLSAWDSTTGDHKNALPQRIVVSFTIEDEYGQEHDFSSGWLVGMKS